MGYLYLLVSGQWVTVLTVNHDPRDPSRFADPFDPLPQCPLLWDVMVVCVVAPEWDGPVR